MYSIGIDLGGTTIKGMILGSDGFRSEIVRVPTYTPSAGKTVLENIIILIERLLTENQHKCEIHGIGIGSPGFIDLNGNVLGGAENIPGWEGTQIFTPVIEKFGVPVKAFNDVTVMAFGEYRFGAARGIKNCVCIALGTGVGGGLIIDGRLYGGTHGMAGELGHICIDTNGVSCNCGQKGCLEKYVSAPGIVAMAIAECENLKGRRSTAFVKCVRSNPEMLTSKTVYDYVKSGDPVAMHINELVCEKLARGIGIAANIIAPDRVVLGGGVMMAGQIIADTVKKYISKFCWRSIYERFDITIAELGEDAGVLGAAAIVVDDTK
jgi:glucokinase